MLWGYYKKLVIADVLAIYVKKVYDTPKEYTGFALLLASFFFTIQIYCDFSGYSDIAIGTAKLFGIELVTNFRSPYYSSSIREFWSRWHISLSTWFRDYVYIPLGGNRKGKIRQSLNVLITFLASGLWHGANWTYVLWGGCHGVAQVIENLFTDRNITKNNYVRFVRMIVVFAFCVFAWVLFASNTIGDAFYVYSNCFRGIGNLWEYLFKGFSDVGLGWEVFSVIAFSVLVMVIYDYISLRSDFSKWISEKSILLSGGFYLLVSLMVVFLSNKGIAAEFIYFQF